MVLFFAHRSSCKCLWKADPALGVRDTVKNKHSSRVYNLVRDAVIHLIDTREGAVLLSPGRGGAGCECRIGDLSLSCLSERECCPEEVT